MTVPHYTYLVLKITGPRGIIIVKGSFKLSDLCNKEFHKMAQTFGKTGSATATITKQPEENYVEPEVKKLRVQASDAKEAIAQKSGTPPT
jgi:hypothetical protein